MRGKTATYIVSLLSSWAGYGANLLVMFFLSPYVVHCLDDSRYGVWSLLMTVTGYLGLAELGVRVSTGRYINYYLGRNEPRQVEHVINTSLVFYLLMALPIFAVSLAVGRLFGDIFPKIDPALAAQAPTILLITGFNVWLGLIASTFAQLLAARNRFDLSNLAQILTLGVRAGGTVWVLQQGMGLVELSLVLLVSTVTGTVLTVLFSRWKGVTARLSLALASWRSFRQMFTFGAWSFVGNFSARLIDYFSAILIAILLGEREIAHFAIGMMLISYGRDVIAYVTRVITPDIQKAAGGAANELPSIMIRTTNATMFLAVPMLCGLLTLGPTFIGLWMGPKYIDSGIVLVIVAFAQFGWLANTPAGTILNAMGHVKLMAAVYAGEALLNLVACVVLVQVFEMGIYGIAVGTLVPSLLVTTGLQLYIGCRWTRIGIRPFLRSTFARWGTATAIFGPLCLLIAYGDRLLAALQGYQYVPGGWGQFWLKTLAATLLYVPIGVGLIYGWRTFGELWARLRRRAAVAPAVAAAADIAPGETLSADSVSPVAARGQMPAKIPQ